ncbi:hypothetical protein [Halocatena salina]|nr:hypothetical protein [Halocatena salina]
MSNDLDDMIECAICNKNDLRQEIDVSGIGEQLESDESHCRG